MFIVKRRHNYSFVFQRRGGVTRLRARWILNATRNATAAAPLKNKRNGVRSS